MVGAGTLAGFGGAQHWAETARRHSLPSHSWQPWPVLSPHWALSTFNKREMQVERRSRPGEGGGGCGVSQGLGLLPGSQAEYNPRTKVWGSSPLRALRGCSAIGDRSSRKQEVCTFRGLARPAKVAEFLFWRLPRIGASLCTGSAATYPGAVGETRDFGSPSREPGGRGRLWTEEGVVGWPSWGKGRVSSLGWAGRLANPRDPASCFSGAQAPLRSGSWWEPSDGAGPLDKGTLGFFPENQKEEGVPMPGCQPLPMGRPAR